MPEVEYTTDVSASREVVWDFVKDMDNWAPFLTGYQRHEKINGDESIWFVKGELGGLTRVAEFKVHVTEWRGPELVTFEMKGLQEPVTGSGCFLSEDISGNSGIPRVERPLPAPRGWLARLWERLSRWLLRRVTGSSDMVPAPVVADGVSKPTRITFRLNVHAGGATGPVLNLLLAPMLKPVAEDLALKIASAVEPH